MFVARRNGVGEGLMRYVICRCTSARANSGTVVAMTLEQRTCSVFVALCLSV